jgi:hypothetical protein
MDEKYIDEYERNMVSIFSGGPYESVGYVSYASVRNIRQNSELLSNLVYGAEVKRRPGRFVSPLLH